MAKFGEPGAAPRGPGGRRKDHKELMALARDHTDLAISTLVEICKGKKHNAGARVSAAGILLDRGWGKAPQHVTVDGELNVRSLNDAELDEAMRQELAAFLVGNRQGTDSEESPAITH